MADGTEDKEATRGKSTEWDAASEQALTIIGLTISPDQYQYIRKAKTGPEAWAALRNVYEKPSRANRIALKREFYTTLHDPSAPIRDYTNRITELSNRLSAIGVTLKDADIVDVLIFNLHPTWASIASTLAAAQGELKLADVIGALVDEEGRRGGMPNSDNNPDESALFARSRRMRSPEQRFKNNVDGCYVCGQRGHIARDCSKRVQPSANVASGEHTDSKPLSNTIFGTVW